MDAHGSFAIFQRCRANRPGFCLDLGRGDGRLAVIGRGKMHYSNGNGLAYVASQQKAVWGLDQATGAARWKSLCGSVVLARPRARRLGRRMGV